MNSPTLKTNRSLLGVAACADLEEYAREHLPTRSSIPAKARALSDAFDSADAASAIGLLTRLGELSRAVRAAVSGSSMGSEAGESSPRSSARTSGGGAGCSSRTS